MHGMGGTFFCWGLRGAGNRGHRGLAMGASELKARASPLPV